MKGLRYKTRQEAERSWDKGIKGNSSSLYTGKVQPPGNTWSGSFPPAIREKKTQVHPQTFPSFPSLVSPFQTYLRLERGDGNGLLQVVCLYCGHCDISVSIPLSLLWINDYFGALSLHFISLARLVSGFLPCNAITNFPVWRVILLFIIFIGLICVCCIISDQFLLFRSDF